MSCANPVIILDLFSRAIVGWKLEETMTSALVTAPLRKAFRAGAVATESVFHSDRRSQ